MNKLIYTLVLIGFLVSTSVFAQTTVPNGGFELWVNHNTYEDPLYWDTPNQEVATIPFIGVTVVSKSTEHESGNYSVKLETKHLSFPPMDIPGFITLGNLTANITTGTFDLTGGAPISDSPTHLQGFYKYLPQGGDSCVVAMLLYKTTSGIRDTIAGTVFSVKTTVSDWTPFSVWIEYLVTEAPDTMNIFALSTAQETGMHPGTTLFLDDLSLDYTVSVNGHVPQKEIDIYQDKETHRFLVFFDFNEPQTTSLTIYSMMGNKVAELQTRVVQKDRREIFFGSLPNGIYLLEILHSGERYCKKFFLNF